MEKITKTELIRTIRFCGYYIRNGLEDGIKEINNGISAEKNEKVRKILVERLLDLKKCLEIFNDITERKDV